MRSSSFAAFCFMYSLPGLSRSGTLVSWPTGTDGKVWCCAVLCCRRDCYRRCSLQRNNTHWSGSVVSVRPPRFMWLTEFRRDTRSNLPQRHIRTHHDLGTIFIHVGARKNQHSKCLRIPTGPKKPPFAARHYALGTIPKWLSGIGFDNQPTLQHRLLYPDLSLNPHRAGQTSAPRKSSSRQCSADCRFYRT